MKRLWFLGALLLLVLAACGLELGVPTVKLALGDVNMSQDQETGEWNLAFTIEAYTLPGSPGGTILYYELEGGEQLTSWTRVASCPADSAEPCGPFVDNYTITYLARPEPGSVVIVAYKVMGDNERTARVVLPEPLKVW